MSNSWATVDNGDGSTGLRRQSVYKNERVARRADVDSIYIVLGYRSGGQSDRRAVQLAIESSLWSFVAVIATPPSTSSTLHCSKGLNYTPILWWPDNLFIIFLKVCLYALTFTQRGQTALQRPIHPVSPAVGS